MLKEKIIKTILILIVSGFTAYHILSWTHIPGMLSDFINLQTNASTVSHVSTGQSVKTTAAPTSESINKYTENPVEIKIPSVNIDLSVINSRKINNSTWDISLNLANFAEGTAYPNPTSGNTVIFGHDLNNVFAPIHNIKVNDTIILNTASTVFTYKVSRIDIVPGNAVQIMNQTSTPLLTIFTCDGWLSQNRFVAFAGLINIKSKE